MKTLSAIITSIILAAAYTMACAQAMYQQTARVVAAPPDTVTPVQVLDNIANPADSLSVIPELPYDTVMVMDPLPQIFFTTPVYTKYVIPDTPFDPFAPELTGTAGMEWIERNKAVADRAARMFQTFVINNPHLVTENIAFMEKAPRQYYGEVNPKDHTIKLKEIKLDAPAKMEESEVKKRHWLRNFSASLQFSQAYVSPNWYQGGNNNLNMIANVYYNVKLNPAYHKNLLFESTMQYKLGMNSAPDDSLRNYSISDDILQLNLTFGVKAAKHWYYSVTSQFKTQLLTAYVKNTRNIASAFLSPGEFTAGLGMTYTYANARKTFTLDASIAPLSYNMKICTRPNNVLAHSAYGIDPDRKYVMKYGSNAEAKMLWKICDNISFRSRLFVFTDYTYFQADWENTLSMEINKYLATQIYVHARYDTSTPPCDDPSWHKLQVKEILSFGVTYKFSSI